MQVRVMFERWRGTPDAGPASQAIWESERFSQSPVDLRGHEPARDTSIPCYAYEFVDRNGEWHWRAEITPQQRAEIDSFLHIKRSVKIAYADLQLTILDALSAATGRSCYELSGPENMRAAASDVPEPHLVFEAIGALEDRTARQLALAPFTVHELKSGGLVFSLGTSRWPKKFTLVQLRDLGAATEKNMRVALSRLSSWRDRTCRKGFE